MNVERIDKTIFNESILIETLANAPSLKKIDSLFDELLNIIKIEENNISGKARYNITSLLEDKKWDDIFYKIEKIINKLFNIKLSFKLAVAKNGSVYPMNFMYTFVPYGTLKELSLKILEDGEGYHFYKLNGYGIEIHVEEEFFFFCKMNGWTGRMLTATILHEIGHHVFLEVNNKILSENKGLEIIINKAMVFSAFWSVIMGYFTLITVATDDINKIKLTALNTIISILSSRLCYHILKFMTLSSLKYVRTESNADSLSVKYGYSLEIYKLFTYIAGSGTKDKEKFNWSLYRLDNIYDMTLKEIEDKSNSPRNIKELKEAKKEMDKLEKLRKEKNLPIQDISKIVTKKLKMMDGNDEPFIKMIKKLFTKKDKNSKIIEEMEILFK